MGKTEGTLAEKVLNYWFAIEFLSQDSYPGSYDIMNKVKRHKAKVAAGKKSFKCLETFIRLDSNDMDKDLFQIIEKEAGDCKMKLWGNITVYVGKVKRDFCVEELSRSIKVDSSCISRKPEKTNERIAMASFQLSPAGRFLEKSMSLSPILWALGKLKNSDGDLSKYLRAKDYAMDVKGIEEKFFDKFTDKKVSSDITENTSAAVEAVKLENIGALYNYIVDKYIDGNLHATEDGVDPYEEVYGISFQMYADEATKDKKEDDNYLGLSHDFFSNDIAMVLDKVKTGSLSEHGKMTEDLMKYIEITDFEPSARIDLVNPDDKLFYRDKLNELLDPMKAPLGKWPSKYMPAMMQEIAINTAGSCNIFSVNGPPGTGKTTLLKEIIVGNIVNRAIKLSQYNNPDDAFESHQFLHGDKDGHAYSQYIKRWYSLKDESVNDYSMLVTSCNNAAVENISKELPKSVLKDLEPGKKDTAEMIEALKEVSDLFDLEKSECIEETKAGEKYKDIYFTNFARKIIDDNDAWGLIAAPMGKKSNLSRFYSEALIKLDIDFYRKTETAIERREQYRKVRDEFNSQLSKVRRMQAEIEDIRKHVMASESGEISDKILELNRQAVDYRNSVGLLTKIFNRKKFDSVNGLADRLERKAAELEVSEEKAKRALEELKKSGQMGEFKALDKTFVDALLDPDAKTSTDAQVSNPWFTQHYNREREKLFFLAMRLNKEFVLCSNHCRDNFKTLGQYWGLRMGDDGKKVEFSQTDKEQMVPALLQTLFLFVPVISTTFASVGSFLRDVKRPGVIGMLVVDEAGQAQPQMAVGALYRSRKAIIVGDPKQIEPVVTDDLALLKYAFNDEQLNFYKQKNVSVQSFADKLNFLGTYLDDGNGVKEWVGSPLIVHRRCISPMYDISNYLSYNGIMKQQTLSPKEEVRATLTKDKSEWIDVTGQEKGNGNHFVEAQGEAVCELLEMSFAKSEEPDIYIISPFVSVVGGIKEYIASYCKSHPDTKIDQEYILDYENKKIGTVHTFQGKEANEVIFLLGCDAGDASSGAIRWVNNNIVNVAVTRAKYRLYIVGDSKAWSKSLCVTTAHTILTR